MLRNILQAAVLTAVPLTGRTPICLDCILLALGLVLSPVRLVYQSCNHSIQVKAAALDAVKDVTWAGLLCMLKILSVLGERVEAVVTLIDLLDGLRESDFV